MLSFAKLMVLSLTLLDVRVQLLDVRVQLLDGGAEDGALQSLTANSIELKSGDGAAKSIPLADVIDVTAVQASESEVHAQPLLVQLRDGSELSVSSIESTAESVTAKSVLLGDFTVPRPLVRAVRLQESQESRAAEWASFLKRSNDKDLLIVAKRDGTGLDFLSGVVSSVGADEVPFLLDGDSIPVPRPRVFGVIFPQNVQGSGGRATGAELRLADGSVIRAETIVLEADRLSVTTAWGHSMMVDIGQVLGIDFSSGRLHYLSDLEPLTERYFGLDPPGREWGALFDDDASTRTGLSAQWRMSRDRFPNNGRPPLTLDGRVYRKGLCIFPSAAIEYALDGRYSRLTAVVGVDDDVASNQQPGESPTAVELRIEADGREVFQQLIKAPEAPVSIDLNMTGVTTLAVFVDFGDGESTCDYLDLADARLIVDTNRK